MERRKTTEQHVADFVAEVARPKGVIVEDAIVCPECAGRGWIGGALRRRNADGTPFIDVNAYKIECRECGGTEHHPNQDVR